MKRAVEALRIGFALCFVTMPEPNNEGSRAAADRLVHAPVQGSGVEDFASLARSAEKLFRQGNFCVVSGRDLHEAARHVHSVTNSSDVFVAAAAQA